MAEKVMKQTQTSIWVPPDDGKFNAAEVFQVGQAGLGDVTLPGLGERTIFYGTDAYGNPVPLGYERAAPGQPTTTVENYLTRYRDLIQKVREEAGCSYLQLRISSCMRIDHPNGWDTLIHLEETQPGDTTISAPTSREFADSRIGMSTPITGLYHVFWVTQSLTALTTTETTDLNGITFLSDLEPCDDCGGGYPGPDQIGYIACDAAGATTANILYTANGGSTWAATSADPFAADEHADFPLVFRKDEDEFRLIVARITTDGSNPAEIAWDDITFGAEGTTTWNTVNVGSNNGDIITAMFWPKWNRLYAATDNNTIHLSTDQGETWSTIHTGSQPIRAFTLNPRDNSVYAVGDSNTILRETGFSGTFSALTGPTGTNNSNAITVASDGTIWLGNGTSIFYTSSTTPTAAGQWTSQKDFGTNHSVRQIDCKAGPQVRAGLGGSSQLIHVLVNDSTANEGDMWIAADGKSLNEIKNLTNSGYNRCYFSPVNPNLAFICGEDNGSTGVIHKLAPAGGV